MLTVPEIISLWPSASEFARDLGLRRETHATVMKSRGSIPHGYWVDVVDAAKKRGIALSLDDLATAHARPSPDTERPAA